MNVFLIKKIQIMTLRAQFQMLMLPVSAKQPTVMFSFVTFWFC